MSKDIEALQAEAEAGDGSVAVTLETEAGSAQLHVRPTLQWKSSGFRAMREDNFDVWAEKCLTPESYATWRRLDPTIAEAADFIARWNTGTGQDSGKSQPSGASSKSTPEK